ncbi:DUF4262 domain-containing protein [Sphingomonas sp. RT2P30]|uniref:DUF4262 domain-containing protein n=1 Tax=Parasphingomonas halimpatiens TaxID=3096162 RepID=UPI002FC81BB1
MTRAHGCAAGKLRHPVTMHTALDTPTDALDEQERSFVASIREHGWFRTSVLAEEDLPGFSYTTGFWRNTGLPELIIFGLKHEIAHDVMWDLFRDAQAGRRLPCGVRTDAVFANLPAYVFLVARRHYAAHLGWSQRFYGDDDFECRQIVWPDRNELFPWEAGFDETFVGDQVDLTELGWVAALAH